MKPCVEELKHFTFHMFPKARFPEKFGMQTNSDECGKVVLIADTKSSPQKKTHALKFNEMHVDLKTVPINKGVIMKLF